MNTTKLLCFITFFILLITKLPAQNFINATVIDAESNAPIRDVSVQITNTDKGTYTDTNGFFSINNLDDNSILLLSKIGYHSVTINTTAIDSTIYLYPQVNVLDEVVLTGFSSSQLKKVVPDQIYFSKKDIKNLPFILGEKDVLKLIQYTPGVQQATEGQSGFLVRGGNGSMNLTLLDNIYVHNTAHLGGLFSTINSDFVHSLEFSKAGFDASYGGRLSSVTDIKTLKQPDSTYFEGSLGLLTTKLTGNIKINKNNSLLLSGKRSYLEVFKPFSRDDSSFISKDKNYFLYDFLSKYSLKLSEKSNLETTFYITSDNFTDQAEGIDRKVKWGNILFGSTFKHQFSPSLSSKTTIANSSYNFSFSSLELPYNYGSESSFNVLSVKHSFLLAKKDYLLKIGAAYNKNNILPKLTNVSIDDTPITISNQENYKYDDVSLYSDLTLPISSKLKLKSGLRLTSSFTKENNLIDNETFFNIEPRLSLKYQLKEDYAFKLSYQRLSQFVHQASINSFSIPVDFFVISTKNIKPQIVNQFSLGYTYEVNNFQLNSAIYYKDVSNFTEFKNGSVNNLFSDNIYEDIVIGKFNSYGFEASINKRINKFTTQLSLTLSKTLAKFEDINQGNYFPTTFDRPINVNTILQYKLNKRIELGALFILTSGQTYTKPNDIRIINEKPILNFEAKNASRYPNYHRLDLSCTYAFKKKKNKKWQSKLNVTLYNVYNNENPFQIYYNTEGDINEAAIEISEKRDNLFPFLPTINWLFSF